MREQGRDGETNDIFGCDVYRRLMVVVSPCGRGTYQIMTISSSLPTNWYVLRMFCSRMLLFVLCPLFGPLYIDEAATLVRIPPCSLYISLDRVCTYIIHIQRARIRRYVCTDRGCTNAKRINCSLCLHASAEASKRSRDIFWTLNVPCGSRVAPRLRVR